MYRSLSTQIRSSKSFEDITYDETHVRDLRKNGEYYEPPTYTLEETIDMIGMIGQVKTVECYIDEETAFNVVRGWVLKDDGKEYFFYHQYFELYRSAIRGLVSALQYSGRDSNGI